MKRIYSIAFSLGLLFATASTISAQGLYIYKNGQRQVINQADVDSIVFFAAEKHTETVTELPNVNFGTKLEIIRSQSQNSGYNVAESETHDKLTLTKPNVANTLWEYNFDINQVYQYAKASIPQDKVESIKTLLNQKGFSVQADASKNKDVIVFVNSRDKLVAFLDNQGSTTHFYVGAYNEAANSWTRISPLYDEITNLNFPYWGYMAPMEMVFLFEKRQNHTLNETKTIRDNGVYVFDTGNDAYPQVKYWTEAKTKTNLQEFALYVNKNDIPRVAAVKSYLEPQGFYYVGEDLDGSTIYFNYDTNDATYLYMVDKNGDGNAFEPRLQFVYAPSLAQRVPPRNINFPMPITTFGTMTLDQVLEEYKKQPYYKGWKKDDNGLGYLIETTSNDYPYILLMEYDENTHIYAAANVITLSPSIIRSSTTIEKFIEQGYKKGVRKGGGDLAGIPTYISKDKEIMIQIDATDPFGLGWYTMSFSPNEFKDKAE